MKYILTIAAFTLATAFASAQNNSGATKQRSNGDSGRVNKAGSSKQVAPKANKLPKGTRMAGGKIVPVHNGPHNYTPGSPIGTGGAGGGSMSGSPQGSASKNALGEKPSDELLEEKNAVTDDRTETKASSAKKKSGANKGKKTSKSSKKRSGNN